MTTMNFLRHVVASVAGKTAAERIASEKAAVERQYELSVAKAEKEFSVGTERVATEVSAEVQAIESSIALALRRAEALKATGAVTDDHKTRLDSALNGTLTH